MSLVGKLASRLGRSSAWYVFASAGVVAAIAAVTSLLTWWPNDGDKPIVHPAEAIERLLPEGALDRVDGHVASLLGVDKEAVRTVRKGLVQGGSGIAPQLGGRLYEIATGQPVSDSPGFATLVPASLPTPGTDVPVPIPEEPSQTTGEAPAPVTSAPSLPPTDTTSPSPATGETPPLATEDPPLTSEPSLPPPTGSTPPPTTGDPPPTSSSPPTSSPPPPDEPPTSPPPPTDEPQPPTNTPSPPPTTVSPTTGGN